MAVNWNEVQRALSPLKDYEDCCRRFEEAFAYSFVCEVFNYPTPEIVDYTQKLLLGDSRGRYVEYSTRLVTVMHAIDQAGVRDVHDLAMRCNSRLKLEAFIDQTNLSALAIAAVLKFLVYWFIPNQKYLSGLVRDDPETLAAIKMLRDFGIRTNLDMLERGRTAPARKSLAETSGLPEQMVSGLVNRADFSRLPWASKATISNIIGAGYPSLRALASANPEQLYRDFFAYGKKIGKNLKLGNEIENSYRIAKIAPVILEN
jgi:Domain of unknown function (DUF4332)